MKNNCRWGTLATMAMMAGCTTLPWEHPPRTDAPPGSTIAKNAEETADRIAYLKEQQARSQQQVELAMEAERAGDLDRAESLLRDALASDRQNNRAVIELDRIASLRRHPGMVAEARRLLEQGDEFSAEKRVRQVLMENPKNPEALDVYTSILKRREDKKVLVPVLKTIHNKPISLEFREANVKMVFEALSKSTGINFILDKDIRPDQKTTIFIKDAPLQGVLDSLLSANQLQKKIINENTMVIYPNTSNKAREYQELVMRTFYLANADVKQTATLLKSMLQVKDVYTDDKINLLVIRDTLEVIRIAEQLILAQDIADPEVVLDVEILEINRSKAIELGIEYPNQISVLSPEETSLTLKALKSLSSTEIGVSPNPAINFKHTDGLANLLANPTIRVRNREKARIHIGDRVPIITSNISPTAGAISESVQYVDVGLKLEVEPVVNIDNQVAIKVSLDVGSLGQSFTTRSGSLVYQIGTRNATTLLRLQDGETQILAGLISDQERTDISKLPGLGDIPLLGRIFSNKADQRMKTDIILSITPHVIRSLPAPTAANSEVVIGTENDLGRVSTRLGGGIPAALAPFLGAPRPAPPPAPAAPAAPAASPPAGGNGNDADKQQPYPDSGMGLPKNLVLPLGQPPEQ